MIARTSYRIARASRQAIGCCIAAVVLFNSGLPGASAETRSYIVQIIHTATYAQPDNCPGGGNGERADVQRRILLSRGYHEDQAKQIIDYYGETIDGMNAPPADYHGLHFDFDKRGTLFDKPVRIGTFPTSEPDPHIETAQGRYMYGFDLTGKEVPESFEDPETHERVEDQMWRVLGCFAAFHNPLSITPYAESLTWETAEDAMPPWLISISGPDLSKDGEVSVTFDRALNLLRRNAYGGGLRRASYTVDPNPKSHSVFKGHIHNDVVTIEPGNLFLQGEKPFYDVLRLSQAHLRLKLKPDPATLRFGGTGVVSGLVGGYQPWLDVYHFLSDEGEEETHLDIAGVYYAIQRLADADPDPVTRKNRAISAVYYFEASPVLLTDVLAPEASEAISAQPRVLTLNELPKVPETTPAGITVVEVTKELALSVPQLLWLRPGDAYGHTLLLSDKDSPGRSRCENACAREFPPLLATRKAQAMGDWTLVRRADGNRQWAYQSHPLYTWIKEQTPGEVATNVGVTETANQKQAEQPEKVGTLLPPDDWHVARFSFSTSTPLPDGIGVSMISSAQSVALTDAAGMTLYTFETSPARDGQTCDHGGCNIKWRPVIAPELAGGSGEFSVVTRADGSRQWAYKRRPLYVYGGDRLPGDAYGLGLDRRWKIAALTKNFRPAGVSVTRLEGYGDTLSVNGMTLYAGRTTESRNGGYNLRGNYTYAYSKSKQMGPQACLDSECLKLWHPFFAPEDAQPQDFWEPITRPDGKLQWAYKGGALYTYGGDVAPGDHNGQGIHDYAVGDGSPDDLKRTLLLADFERGSPGVYWNIAKP